MVIILYEQADSPDLFYRVGWDSDVKCLLIDDGTPTLYVPGFEFLRAQADLSDIRVEKLLHPKEILETITEPVETNATFPHALAKYLSTEITVKRDVYESRHEKTPEEIAKVREAQELTQQAIQRVVDLLEASELIDGVAHYQGNVLTSEYCKAVARAYLIEHGADSPSMIVASGEQTSQPHNRGSGPLVAGPVIIDCFGKAQNNYHGDCTRTIILGEHHDAQRMLDACKQAHDACVKKCVPGQKISELFELAESILKKHGFESNDETGFIHSLGHGVGLAIHEDPNLAPSNDDELKAGMTITIEPGLYYDVGVRYENIVVVGEEPEILGLR